MPQVLLTAFEPFGGQSRNSSLEVARALAGAPPEGVSIDLVVLPVVAFACAEIAWQRITARKPALVLALGQAGGATHVRLEDRAVNRDDFSMPDNSGGQRRGQPIVPGGPEIEKAGVGIEQVLVQVRQAGFPVLHSLSAGRYVCNHLYYQLLHRARVGGLSHATLFVHLPYLDDQVPAGRLVPYQPLAHQVGCLRAVLLACLESAS